jgi:hypothetical protein
VPLCHRVTGFPEVEGVSIMDYFWTVVYIIGIIWALSTIYKHRNRPKPPAKPEWKVQVTPASIWRGDYMDSTVSIDESQMAIRLVRGEETMTITTIKIGQVDFEDQLHKAVAQAEEKASTLNAIYLEVNA